MIYLKGAVLFKAIDCLKFTGEAIFCTSMAQKKSGNSLPNYFLVLLFVLPAVAYGLFSYYIRPLEKNLFPAQADALKLHAFDDSAQGGNSRVHTLTNTDSLLAISLTLHPKRKFPFAGLIVEHKEKPFFNLNAWDGIKLRLKAQHSERIPVCLNVHVDSLTKPDVFMSYLLKLQEITLDSGFTTCRLPLEDFTIPDWWFTENNIPFKQLPSTYHKTRSITLYNSRALPIDLRERIMVSKIAFYKNYTTSRLWFAGSILAFYFVLGGWLFYKKRGKRSGMPVVLPEGENLTSYVDEATAEVLNYISEYYNDPELTLAKVSQGTGLSEKSITRLFNQNNISFKQYLNQTRIARGKEWLVKTDRQIAEIAYLIGYQHVQHFNRVFKKLMHVTPRQYREQYGE